MACGTDGVGGWIVAIHRHEWDTSGGWRGPNEKLEVLEAGNERAGAEVWEVCLDGVNATVIRQNGR